MLCDQANPDDCSIMQINDPENYVRYHLITLLENIRKSKTKNQLKTIILGCTHYPYMMQKFERVLAELYAYKSLDGNYVYRHNMAEHIELIDPSVNTAKELHEHLRQDDLINPSGDIYKSEFYISVANRDNKENEINEDGNFPYDCKYGRDVGNIQEYVKVVPFSKSNISSDILMRFQNQIPFVYDLMKDFNQSSPKTVGLTCAQRID
jgi:hypothetical protein